MDTGATAHMFAHPGNLASFTPVSTDRRIIVGDGSTLPITHVGHTYPSTSMPITLSNILVSPHLIKNLVSVRRLTGENPVIVEFDEFGFCVKDAQTRMVLHRCDSPDEHHCRRRFHTTYHTCRAYLSFYFYAYYFV